MTDETDNVITVDAWNYKPMQSESRGGVPTENVIEAAAEIAEHLESIVIFGICKDGSLFGATSNEHIADTLLLIERIRMKLMSNFSGDSFD
jgi:hypothetical protein